MSLANDDSDGEQNDIRVLQTQLESTNRLVKELSLQLAELKDQVPSFTDTHIVILTQALSHRLCHTDSVTHTLSHRLCHTDSVTHTLSHRRCHTHWTV